MPTTIKINHEFKREIDKLQAKVILKTGEKITQQELLVRILRFVIRNEEEFFKNYIFDWESLDDSEWEKLKTFITAFGKISKESTIDREIYGE
ncbi:MAG: hypothetical protein ACTSP4_12735 [Candidatus Hodarchaeales archaeon]